MSAISSLLRCSIRVRKPGESSGIVSGKYKPRSGAWPLIVASLKSAFSCFDEVKKRSREAGALGGGISGSGPSVFMLNTEEIGDNVLSVEVKAKKNSQSEVYKINRNRSYVEETVVSKVK